MYKSKKKKITDNVVTEIVHVPAPQSNRGDSDDDVSTRPMLVWKLNFGAAKINNSCVENVFWSQCQNKSFFFIYPAKSSFWFFFKKIPRWYKLFICR